jgi:NAD(P)H-hydrate epimerase
MTNPDATSLEQIQYDEKQRINGVNEVLAKAKVIVDGVFGTGFHGQLDKEVAAFLNAETSAYKFAVDIPSGGNCKTGEVSEGTFAADETIAFGAVKTGMTQYPLKSLCGKIRVADIGIPEKAYDVLKGERTYTLADREELEGFPKKRKPDAHKGCFGRVLCITGSSRMRGASALSALGALRSGAGLVTVASVEKAVDTVAVLAPEATFCELESDDFGFMQCDINKLLLREEIEKADAILIGCGMGVTEDTAELTKFVIENAKCPVIVDADGINCIALDIDILLRKRTELILTPHPGEMARLLGCGASEINSDRLSVAGEFARLYGTDVVLKGAGTVVAGAKYTTVIETGNPGMSCGGSGDVLAGIIASLAAQGYSTYDAARFGAYIHGAAGDIAAERLGQEFMLPRDIIDALSDSIRKVSIL